MEEKNAIIPESIIFSWFNILYPTPSVSPRYTLFSDLSSWYRLSSSVGNTRKWLHDAKCQPDLDKKTTGGFKTKQNFVRLSIRGYLYLKPQYLSEFLKSEISGRKLDLVGLVSWRVLSIFTLAFLLFLGSAWQATVKLLRNLLRN